jgi:hypothetical protein
VFLKLKVYEDEFNKCQKEARNTKDAYFCGNQFIRRIDEDVVAYTKTVLDEY